MGLMSPNRMSPKTDRKPAEICKISRSRENANVSNVSSRARRIYINNYLSRGALQAPLYGD